jgi:hypothetical protein
VKGPNFIANFKIKLFRRRLLIAVIVSSAVCFALPEHASGQTVRFNFEATVVSTSWSAFPVGEIIVGSYTFDSTAPDLDGSTGRGEYRAVLSLTLTTSGGYSASAAAASGNGFIEVLNDTPDLTKDRYVASMEEPTMTFTAPSVGGADLTFLRIVLRSSMTSTFPSDALPLVPPPLLNFDRGAEVFLGSNGVELVRAEVTSFTVETSDPVTQIGFIMEAIEILESVGTLDDGVSKALLGKLDAAAKQAEKQPQAAVGVLSAFIQQVSTLVAHGDLSEAEGQSLIAAAEQVIAALTP